ncbi:DeoR/GlpR family DNA-binding transcription regulator [Ornithinimicrobium cerasi]|uniref:DeoR/GlpR family DNA-binding transcription regulator n=1 Tax=Ornithinimicrobium cerasi TaxID=2248773 RepID=UPI000EFE1425|nr:DeoR/GlpR family DNA-binding transcription regulator [Ornithinimicrobium cerasi]
MYAQERQQHIARQARTAGRVEVVALAHELGVTTETVRRDLTALERRGTLRRVHGGALPVERVELEPAVTTRATRLSDQKHRIAVRALDELPHDGTLILDSGTTTGALAALLPHDARLTVITNSYAHAAVLSALPDVSVLVLGGHVRQRTGATVGRWAREALEGVCADVALLGTNGLDIARGLTTPDQAEADVKESMVRAARRRIVLADSSKVGEVHLHRFARLDDLDLVITDEDLDEDHLAELRTDDGPEVVLA